MAQLEGEGTVIGKIAPDFMLPDQHLNLVSLAEECRKNVVLLVFYPGDFTLICTKQLCNYRDNLEAFAAFGVSIFGISPNTVDSHTEFTKTYGFPFQLLSDTTKQVIKKFDCLSVLIPGRVTRAVFIINSDRLILFRYVEPTILTRRSAKELIAVLSDLKKHRLI